ncbi:hypothetical protein L9F63_004955, partial [Diploptera punctata]
MGGLYVMTISFVKIYQNIQGNTSEKLAFDSCLFEINTPFARIQCTTSPDEKELPSNSGRKKYKKRKRITPDMTDIMYIEQNVADLMKEVKDIGFFIYVPTLNDVKQNNVSARDTANNFYLKYKMSPAINMHGCNGTQNSLITQINGENYVIPADCRFFCYDVKEITTKVDLMSAPYDLVLLDPPWWNKYIRRKRAKCEEAGYQMLYNEELTCIPIPALTLPGSLIAVWCTNSPSHFSSLCDVIFPAWDVEYIAKWFWVKVTRGGDPVCQFSPPPGKQPFEQIVFGCRKGGQRLQPLPEENKLIISVPSAIHSHKPPLRDVLVPYLPATPQCLELFARYLLPGWTSWGYEVLKLQHCSLYKEIRRHRPAEPCPGDRNRSRC